MTKIGKLLEDHANGTSRLAIRTIVHESDTEDAGPAQQFLLIEGNSESLRFLANLILAQTEPYNCCNIHLHPTGAGNSHFAPGSKVGIYIHRLPCDLHPNNEIR